MPSKSTTYWDAMDFESEENSEFSSSPQETLRNYVDPWDLENYAYIRKHLASTPEPSTPTFVGGEPTFVGEPTDSTFYYIPGGGSGSGGGGGGVRRQSDEGDYNLDSFLYPPETIYGNTVNKFAGIDEAQFHNERILNANELYSSGEYATSSTIRNHNIEPTYVRRQRSIITQQQQQLQPQQNEKIYDERRMQHSTEYSDMETSSECEDDSSPMVSDEPVVYVYETNKRRRSMAIPIPSKSMTFIKPRRHSMMAKTTLPKDYDRYGSQSSDYTPTRSSIYGKINPIKPIKNTHQQQEQIYGYSQSELAQPIYVDRSDIYNTNTLAAHSYRDDNNIYGTYKIRKASTHKSIKSNVLLEPTMPIYDQATILRRLKKPTNFGLSNYGHLKIDYSFNWNTLDRFIRT
ncbi:uncharacterized protein LOC123296804 [Chrysoperla carnea]|uniref:uncharacterized protein LOC123296804 n=1 Tax=Chrysoperla carnea TaxID=189513 RepID=UPI001D05C93F|nr:uncharacterized protein LOC123296804 [Chrysoperla carnea]